MVPKIFHRPQLHRITHDDVDFAVVQTRVMVAFVDMKTNHGHFTSMIHRQLMDDLQPELLLLYGGTLR